MGTDGLKNVLGLFLTIIMLVAVLLTQEWAKALGLLKDAGKYAIAAFAQWPQLIPQWKDLTDVERDELKTFVVSTFDIADDQVEEKIEKALKLVVDLLYWIKPLIPAKA